MLHLPTVHCSPAFLHWQYLPQVARISKTHFICWFFSSVEKEWPDSIMCSLIVKVVRMRNRSLENGRVTHGQELNLYMCFQCPVEKSMTGRALQPSWRPIFQGSSYNTTVKAFKFKFIILDAYTCYYYLLLSQYK